MGEARSLQDDRPTWSIVQYWHSASPPPEVVDALASFPELNPGTRHLVFDQGKADAFIEEHFSSRELAAFRSCAIPAMQADYFRYCAVCALGGVYVDADLKCAAGLQPLLGESWECGLMFGRQGLPATRVEQLYGWPYEVGPFQAVGNGFFAFREPRHSLLATTIEIATVNIERRIADGPRGVWLTAGPGIFTSMYLLGQLGSIDAFIRYSAATILAPTARLFCEIVGDSNRIESMFDGISIRPRGECDSWITPVKVVRPRDGKEAHWMRVSGSIFR